MLQRFGNREWLLEYLEKIGKVGHRPDPETLSLQAVHQLCHGDAAGPDTERPWLGPLDGGQELIEIRDEAPISFQGTIVAYHFA